MVGQSSDSCEDIGLSHAIHSLLTLGKGPSHIRLTTQRNIVLWCDMWCLMSLCVSVLYGCVYISVHLFIQYRVGTLCTSCVSMRLMTYVVVSLNLLIFTSIRYFVVRVECTSPCMLN